MTKIIQELVREFLVKHASPCPSEDCIFKFADYFTSQGYKVVKEECKHEWTNPDSNCQHSYCVHCRIIKEPPQPKKIEKLKDPYVEALEDAVGVIHHPNKLEIVIKINEIIDRLNK